MSERVAQPPAERLGERGLARADGPPDADLERTRDVAGRAHERNSRASSVACRMAASSRPGLKRPHLVRRCQRRRRGQPRDARPHRGERALAVELAQRDEPQPRTDEQGRRRVEIRAGRELRLHAGPAERRAERHGVMAGREAVDGRPLDSRREQNPRRASPPPAASAAPSAGWPRAARGTAFMASSSLVERDAIAATSSLACQPDGQRGSRGVRRPRRALEVRRRRTPRVPPGRRTTPSCT